MENPYKSLYLDGWELALDSTPYMKMYHSVREMVRHMEVESDRLVVGTHHEWKVLFNRNALILITVKVTQKWMMTELV